MITRIERELNGLRKRIAAIDQQLDTIATAHATKIGSRGETPAELVLRVVADRDTFRWLLSVVGSKLGSDAISMILAASQVAPISLA
jgi:hypothetical protein